MRAQTDTRTRIQEIAVRLFTEKGYEATSLREIAEALGMTKAALYYHFRTKEDIISSLVQDRIRHLDELIEWARRQPQTLEAKREIIRRYAEHLTHGRQKDVMRLMECNQASLGRHPKIAEVHGKVFELIDVLCGPEATLTARLRCTMALVSLHTVWLLPAGDDLAPHERMASALEVALDLIGGAVRPAPGDGR